MKDNVDKGKMTEQNSCVYFRHHSPFLGPATCWQDTHKSSSKSSQKWQGLLDMTGRLLLTTSLICLSSEGWSKKLSGALCILFVCFPVSPPQVVLVTHFSNFPCCCFFNAMHITLLYTSIYLFIIIKCLSSARLVHFYIVLRKKINVKCCWVTVFVCPFSGNRLFPVLPGNGRITQDDLVVGGYFIPKGVRPMET